MIDNSKIVKVLCDNKQHAQLDVLVHLMNVEEDYLSGIAAATGISHSSVSRVAAPLIELGLIYDRMVGKQVRMLRINKESEIVKSLRLCFEELSELVK